MKLLAQNSRGLRSQAARLAMRDVTNSARPNVMFISETKSSVKSLVNFFWWGQFSQLCGSRCSWILGRAYCMLAEWYWY